MSDFLAGAVSVLLAEAVALLVALATGDAVIHTIGTITPMLH